jgi:hypothetical protein
VYLTNAASILHSQTKKIKAHDSTKSSPKLFPRTSDMKGLLDVFIPGVKRTFLQLGAIGVAKGIRDPDGFEPETQDMEACGGYGCGCGIA